MGTAVVSFLWAAGAFALPALGLLVRLDSPSRRSWVRPSLGLGAGLMLVWAVNLASLVGGSSWSSAQWFVAMNLGFLGSTLAGLGAVLVALALTRLGPRGLLLAAWGLVTLVLWLIGLYRALLLSSSSNGLVFQYGEVFTFGTLAGAISVALALGPLWTRGPTLEPGIRRGLSRFRWSWVP